MYTREPAVTSAGNLLTAIVEPVLVAVTNAVAVGVVELPLNSDNDKSRMITSVFVGIMVVVAALFLQLVDLILGWSLSFILNFANGG